MIICCCLLEAQLRGNPCIQPLHQPAERQLCGEKVRNHRVFPEGFVIPLKAVQLAEITVRALMKFKISLSEIINLCL